MRREALYDLAGAGSYSVCEGEALYNFARPGSYSACEEKHCMTSPDLGAIVHVKENTTTQRDNKKEK